MYIPLHKVYLPPRDELMPALEEVLYSGYIAEGPKVAEFENKFSEFVHAESYAVSSCTAALHMALILSGVKEGDEVVSTPMTAEPTNVAIHMAGAKVRWADVDSVTGNVTPETISKAMTEKTKAIMVVHYGGIPVVPFITNVPIIEDCAHALGSVGTGWGYWQTYSFQAIKHMTTCAEGGMLCTPHPMNSSYIKKLRWFGIERGANRTSVDVKEHGWKYNMTDVQATVGLLALKHLPSLIEKIKHNGNYLEQELLSNVPGLKVHHTKDYIPSYLFYTVLAERRDDLARKLTEAGIACGQVHRRNDEHSVFAYAKRELPGLDAYYSKMLHIPCHYALSSENLNYIISVIKNGW